MNKNKHIKECVQSGLTRTVKIKNMDTKPECSVPIRLFAPPKPAGVNKK